MTTAKKTKAKKSVTSAKRTRTVQAKGKSNGRSLRAGRSGTAVTDASVFDDIGGEELVGSSLTWTPLRLLGRVARF